MTTVTAIHIKLPNRTIKLTADEARKVYDELVRVFASMPSGIDAIAPVHAPFPIYVEHTPWPPHWTTWCGKTETEQTLCIKAQ